jgi:uncharacterized protein
MASTRRMRIRMGTLSMEAELNTSQTATLIWTALPIEATAQTWGDEIYFSIPVRASEEEDARAVVDVGTIAYWPPGNAFCIFFGPTPASRNRKPRECGGDSVRRFHDVPAGWRGHDTLPRSYEWMRLDVAVLDSAFRGRAPI